GRLSGFGFVVDVARRAFGSHLRIETHRGIIFDDAEPDSPPAKPSWRRLSVVPLAVLALALAALLPRLVVLPGTLLALGATLWLAVRLRASEPDDRPNRAVDHA